jgi:undecaprenyl diphosphate synthase
MEKNTKLNHLAIILDGNRTWARQKGLSDFQGHKAGFDNLLDIVPKVKDKGIKYLSVFAFSTENWNRSKLEVDYLMDIFRGFFKGKEIKKLMEENVRITMFGSIQNGKIPADLLNSIQEVEEKTKDNDGFYFNICFNYGSKTEIVEAIKKIPLDEIKNLTPDSFSSYLYSYNIPDVDMVIRTSGQIRLSNFLLWQSAYAEWRFIDTCWPAFDEKCLDEAIEDFNKRTRKFGKV